METKLNVFISYSHKDELLCLELSKHLKPLIRSNQISTWVDRQIFPGQKWDDEIYTQISNADLVLFLLSPDFIDSEYIDENEVKIALQRHGNGQCMIVPIMLRKCDLEFTPFKDLQGLPKDLEPIESKFWHTRDFAFFDVVVGLKRIIENKLASKQADVYERELWKKADGENTIAAYRDYLEKSQLKRYLDEVIARVRGMNESAFEIEVLKTKLEVLNEQKEKLCIEIHDNLGYLVTCCTITLENLMISERQTSLSEVSDLSGLRGFLHEMGTEVRKLSREYSVDLFSSTFNLATELEKIIYRFNGLKRQKFDFTSEGTELISDFSLRLVVLRIVTELTQNAIRHSRASKIKVAVACNHNDILLQVSDDGIGIPSDMSYGRGLNSVTKRVGYYGGKMSINSISGNGTDINISIPII